MCPRAGHIHIACPEKGKIPHHIHHRPPVYGAIQLPDVFPVSDRRAVQQYGMADCVEFHRVADAVFPCRRLRDEESASAIPRHLRLPDDMDAKLHRPGDRCFHLFKHTERTATIPYHPAIREYRPDQSARL